MSIFNDIRSLSRDAWASAFIISFAAVFIHDLIQFSAIVIVIAISIGYAIAYGLNDFFDADYDKFDEFKSQRNYFVNNSVNYRKLSLILLVLISILTFIAIQFGIRGIIVLSLSFFVMWAYSARPFRFKSRPGLDLVVHSLFVSTYPYYIILFLFQTKIIEIDYLALSLMIIFSFGEQLENQIRDFTVDRLTDHNFTTKFGIRTSMTLMKISTILGMVIIYYYVLFRDLPGFLMPYAVITIPYFLSRIFRSNNMERSDKIINLTKLVAGIYSVGVLVYLIMN
jgi:4-hydroxybenzoate polyprenyltransferase